MISLLQSTEKDKITEIVEKNEDAIKQRIAGVLEANPGISAKEVWYKVMDDKDFVFKARDILVENGLPFDTIYFPKLQKFFVQIVEKYMKA